MSSVRVSVDAQHPQDDALARASQVVEAHGVVVMPTETFYGLSASAFDRAACDRIFEIKGRATTKALPCLIADVAQLGVLVDDVPAVALELADRFWPGPLTLVLPALEGVIAASQAGTVAVRVSSLPLARRLPALVGPVTTTSANLAGRAPATTADEVSAQLGDSVDLLLDGGATAGGSPSTIVDVSRGAPELVREGAVPWADITGP